MNQRQKPIRKRQTLSSLKTNGLFLFPYTSALRQIIQYAKSVRYLLLSNTLKSIYTPDYLLSNYICHNYRTKCFFLACSSLRIKNSGIFQMRISFPNSLRNLSRNGSNHAFSAFFTIRIKRIFKFSASFN